MANELQGSMRGWVAALVGGIVGLCAGYLFFHDDGDSFVAGWLPAAILGVAFAFVGYFLAKPRADRR